MCAVKQLITGVVSFLFIINSNGKPIFLNHTFITSLLGSSSGLGSQNSFQDNPDSENIAIVAKPQKLQQQNGDDSIFFPTEPNNSFNFDLTTMKPTNEAPSLLKQKLNKLIQKIITVAQIKQVFTGNQQDNSGFMYPYSPDLDDKDIRISKDYGAPLKIDLTRNGDEKDGRKHLEVENKDHKIEPATLGVFLFEVFASLIGLSLGAAGHIEHSLTQNNTI